MKRDKNIVLILTDDYDPHADRMVDALAEWAPELEVVRFHPAWFPEQASLAVGYTGGHMSARLSFYNRTIDLEQVRSIWVRRPKAPALSPQLPDKYRRWAHMEARDTLLGLWNSLDALIVNPIHLGDLANCKSLQLCVAMALGFQIPDTCITNVQESALRFYDGHPEGVIYKPVAMPLLSGGDAASEGLQTTRIGRDVLEGTAGQTVRHVPNQFQSLIDKAFELRITVIGEQLFTAKITSEVPHVDIRNWRTTRPAYETYTLPQDIERKCLAITRHFGLEYGAIDMLVTRGGDYVFLEINPSGQFYWIELATGMPILRTLANHLVAGKKGSGSLCT